MSSIHPTAIVEDGAVLGADVTLGAYCVVGPHAKIGNGTELMAHAVVDGCTTVGRECTIHPFARIGGKTQDLKYKGGAPGVVVGDRTVMRECVTINAGTHDGEMTEVGSDCLLMAYSHVAHACKIGNGVIIANGTQLAGDVIVEDFAIIEGLCGVVQFRRVGKMAFLGGYTKATKDIPPFMIADGLDVQIRGFNKIGMERRGVSEESRAAIKQAYRILYRKKLALPDALEMIESDVPQTPEVKYLLDFIRSSETGIVR
ncbi:acyl-ACP--UDP-N-acetylglucosamine O-acyltransferase [Tichowtungia aerotolerans]|uniref:Acyl-ACP--UDP-N-acetylglucosamine O-acyltransferase n=1 Tax=Tichowtungia aerotolerans TaxID=2697043 RepID=A0A6P1M4X2_9BACT|nr:acyl-ACP--UDP-N-acetylglucosamine O-acyltransferase [Tichowtungia aerotolerans]QHI68887.1 acyl-ACP--UDP-N-acetylglucosamine O-acyltransferase [Tichowtungia aerotolerans]